MRCLVLVKFLPGGSIAPEEFFSRIKAQSYWFEETFEGKEENVDLERIAHARSPRLAMCIAEYDAIEQLAIDLSIMPGAGISNVEILASEEVELSPQEHQLKIPG